MKIAKKPPAKQVKTAGVKPKIVQPVTPLRDVPVGEGLGSITQLRAEIQDYMDVLLGRKDPPAMNGVLTLQECADTYHARACEITILIHQLEADGRVPKGHPLYKFRTGELRYFLDLTKKASELGSRRLTKAKMDFDERHEYTP